MARDPQGAVSGADDAAALDTEFTRGLGLEVQHGTPAQHGQNVVGDLSHVQPPAALRHLAHY